MQANGVVPFKWMAARLGMEERSFGRLLDELPRLGIRPQQFLAYPNAGLVSESLPEYLISHLPGLRFRVFGDHNAFCRQLHIALKDTIGLDVEELFCETAKEIGDWREYAGFFDCLTLKALSGKHAIWLNFRKPLNLEPDRCSKLFYCANHATLADIRAGNADPDLSDYDCFDHRGKKRCHRLSRLTAGFPKAAMRCWAG